MVEEEKVGEAADHKFHRRKRQKKKPKDNNNNNMDGGRLKCSFWLAKKGRRCHYDAKPGFTLCGNHLVQKDRPRVPCPVDPTHVSAVHSIHPTYLSVRLTD